jgi:hypothetical protein
MTISIINYRLSIAQSPVPNPQSPKTGYRGSDRVISRTFPELNLTPEEVFALSNNSNF